MSAELVVMYGIVNHRWGRLARWRITHCDSSEWHAAPYLVDEHGQQFADYRWPPDADCVGGVDFTCPVHHREAIVL